MASSKLLRRKRRAGICLSAFEQIARKSVKLLNEEIGADGTALKLLDVIVKLQDSWQLMAGRFRSKVKNMDLEIQRLLSLQEHTKSLLETEVNRRRAAERKRDNLRRQIDAIREFIQANDVDEAKRCLENLDLRRTSVNEVSVDHRLEHSPGSSLDLANVAAENLSDSDERCPSKCRRASSINNAGMAPRRSSRYKLRSSSVPKITASPPPQPSASKRPNTINRLNRPHDFVSRTLLPMELCNVCGKRITFGKPALKCIVCRLTVHPDCCKQLVQTCVPPNVCHTPLSSMARAPATAPRHAPGGSSSSLSLSHGKKYAPNSESVVTPSSPTLSSRMGARNLILADLCPPDQFPRIPALVIHCITEVLARGMQTVGLYRVSGSEKQVRELCEKFLRGKVTPGLALVDDIHVICGCLKLFLRSLSEPLVTFLQRPALAAASDRARMDLNTSIQDAVDVLDALPEPNRDTLSFIMLHLKTVSRTPACQMGEENLAKVFGPTLVGYSCPEPQLMQTVTETRTQQAVLKLLFAVPDNVYSGILSNADNEQTTYFSPINLAKEGFVAAPTPVKLRRTPGRNNGLGRSSRKRFLLSFLSPHRHQS
ncbi:unnamed protein product [Calicophoron daubneyi]|uniref:Rac GTPase-activating protein 1 n=1 Tax=Calicophoron daubneyi TaxID=300641 RepID=A0AAV2T7Z9_CALDB